MYVCMLKFALAVLPMERGNRLGQGERSLNGPIFPNQQAKLARGTPPTAYYRQSAGSAANFALGLSGLPRGHKDQSVYPGHGGKLRFEIINVMQQIINASQLQR